MLAETAVDVAFVQNPKLDAELKSVEPVLQGIYNASWKMCTDVKFPPADNLTKSVMRVPAGYNDSGYALAAAVNDTPPSYPDATLESIFKACVRAECDGATAAEAQREFEDIATALKTPSPEATLQYAGLMASAMSGVSAFTMPYRVDGTPVVEPTGIKMVQSESWRAEAIRSIAHADDCDGSACSAVSSLKRATTIAEDVSAGGLAETYPYLAALGNSLGAHYVYGTTVLAANAGHADAANEHAAARGGPRHRPGHSQGLVRAWPSRRRPEYRRQEARGQARQPGRCRQGALRRALRGGAARPHPPKGGPEHCQRGAHGV